MHRKVSKYSSEKDLIIKNRFFAFGQVFWVKDSLVSIPNADRVEKRRDMHEHRAVIIISNNKENVNPFCPLITIAPLSTRTDLKREFDVSLDSTIDKTPENCIVQMQLIQPICKADLEEYVCTISEEKQKEVYDAYLEMIGHECES